MGKIKGIFATKISGKVGQVVFRNRAGMNVVSEKPASVKNPRSFAQQAQRMCMATASAAYSGLKVICDHSFEGVTYGADSMAVFMKENVKMLTSGINLENNYQYNAKGNRFVVPNPYLISKGTLPTFVPKNQGVNPDSEGLGKAAMQIFAASSLTATTTVAQFHELLGFDIGDQITILAVYPVAALADTVGVVQNQTAVSYARLVFKTDKASAVLFSESEDTAKSINSENLDLEKSQNYNDVLFTDSEVWIGNNFASPNTSAIIAGMCIIRSKKENGVWRRSTQ